MNGQCLCGAVSFSSPTTREIGACHCGYCRRWGGGPLLAVHCGPDVRFSDPEHITVYQSSDWAERAFCKHCGSHLYYRLLATGEYFVPAGAFDTDDFELASQIQSWPARSMSTGSRPTTISPMTRPCSPSSRAVR